ncbi:MAG: Lrp/AsnC family transcriptional regulator [Paracoccaceae bacterium]
MPDDIDSRLLRAVQRNAHLTTQDLGEILALSPSQAGRRRQMLEHEGYIKDYRATVNPEKLGLSVEAFIQVMMAGHDAVNAKNFVTLIERVEEIVGSWTLTGEADYLLRVYCRDLNALHYIVHDILLPHPSVARVQSQIVMSRVKADSPLPVKL